MSSIKNILALSVMSLSLMGCTQTHNLIHRHDNDYLKQDSGHAALKIPAGTPTKNIHAYFPISEKATTEKTPPSLVPPGSKINQYKADTHLKSSARRVRTNDGVEALQLKMTSAKAWSVLGASLTKSGYPVLDKDKAMGAYFVSDPQQTAGKTTKQTPIYLVTLKADSNTTLISVAKHNNTPLAATISDRILKNLQAHLG